MPRPPSWTFLGPRYFQVQFLIRKMRAGTLPGCDGDRDHTPQKAVNRKLLAWRMRAESHDEVIDAGAGSKEDCCTEPGQWGIDCLLE